MCTADRWMSIYPWIFIKNLIWIVEAEQTIRQVSHSLSDGASGYQPLKPAGLMQSESQALNYILPVGLHGPYWHKGNRVPRILK